MARKWRQADWIPTPEEFEQRKAEVDQKRLDAMKDIQNVTPPLPHIRTYNVGKVGKSIVVNNTKASYE